MSPRARRWLIGGALVAAFPWLPYVPSTLVGAANVAAAYTVVGASLVLLIGWVGQISLGHAALVGIGAYATGWITAGLGVPFPLNLPLAAVVGAGAAALLGLVALRVRGLFLAVATLIFSWMASEFLFRQAWFTKFYQVPDRPIGGDGAFPYFDFTQRRTFYIVAWAVAATALYLAANMRDSKTGRAFFAVRGSEMAAASLGIDVMRYKLVAFAISGAYAGAAGNLIMSDSRVVSADQFTFSASLFFVAIVVVGGLRSLGGTAASAVLFAGLSELFFRVPALGGFLEFVSAALLAVTLLAYRGGLAAIPDAFNRKFGSRIDAVANRIPHAPDRPKLPALGASLGGLLARLPVRLPRRGTRPEEPLAFDRLLAPRDQPEASSNGHAKRHEPVTLSTVDLSELLVPDVPREQRRPLIEADGVTVRFGGLVAVRQACLTVHENEIVGLIGPNGAGKTTLFNSIAGFVVPSEGRIRLYSVDATDLPVHERATLGVARTFQAIQLFGQLTVFENLLVATHVHNSTGVFGHAVVTASALDQEKEARERVRTVLQLLELTALADRPIGDLPFGVLRMVEVARAMVTGFRVMMLDEPASGLDNIETDRLSDVIRFVRGLGVTILLIEHDVRMVTEVSDHMYVLDQGRIIADGSPADIQRDPAVIAAYLGESSAEEVAV